MNLMKIHPIAKAMGVNENDICVGEEAENCLCVFGEGDRWFITHVERGNREVLGSFISEHEACVAFIELLEKIY